MPRITRLRMPAVVGVARASMRPGRNAPDNAGGERYLYHDLQGFNEAGAKCPG